MNFLIISNGAFLNQAAFEKLKAAADCIICVDGGSHMAYHYNTIPDIIIGDLDSIRQSVYQFYVEKKVPFKRFPAEKDQTDTQIAIEYALENGATNLTLIGCTGTRLDHTLANISLLTYIHKQGCSAWIIDNHNEITLMENHLDIKGKPGDFVSLLPLTEHVDSITLTGFKYSLKDGFMIWGNPYGVSNELLQEKGTIRAENGLLLVIKARD